MAEYSITGSGYGGRYTQNMPAYKQPKYDQEQIGLYTQQQMAPGLARLRRGLTSSGAMYSENPAERDAMYRQLMAGYGQGLGELQAGATRAAQGLYEQEYTGMEKQAQRDYERGMSQWDIWRREEEQKKAEQLARQALKEQQPQTWRATLGGMHVGGGVGEPPSMPNYSALYKTGGTRKPLGLPLSGPGERFGISTPTPTVYGAGSEEAYRKAMGLPDLKSGRTY